MFENGYHILLNGNTGLINVKGQRNFENKVELVPITPVDRIVYEIGGADVTINSPTYNQPIDATIVRFAGVRNGELLEKVVFVNKEPDIIIQTRSDPGRYIFGTIQYSNNLVSFIFNANNFLLYQTPRALPVEYLLMAYQEVELGLYVLPLPINLFPLDGQYQILPMEKYQNYYVKAGNPVTINISNGQIVSDDFVTKVYLNHNFERPETLTYVAPDGTPVKDAVIRVYKKSDYDAGLISNPIGVTRTDINGHWVNDIMVDAGEVYYVIFQKEGYFGPDKVEVKAEYGLPQPPSPPPPPTPPPSGQEVHNEPIEGIDGFNRLFHTRYPYVAGTLEVELNGLDLSPNNDYVEVDDRTFLMSYAPLPGDKLQVDYTVK